MEMYDTYLHTLNYEPYLVTKRVRGELVGGMLVVVMKEKGIKSFFSKRAIIIGGPICKRNYDYSCAELLSEWSFVAQKKGVIYTEYRPIYPMDSLRHFFESVGYRRSGHYNIVLPLAYKSERDLYDNMHKERRRNVSHAVKSGLRFEETDYCEEGMRLISQTYQRVKMPLADKSLFENAAKSLRRYIHFFAVYDGERMVAYQVRLCYNGLVYAWYAGSDESAFKKRPNDFLQWNVISWSKRNEYDLFDFGGGGKPGVPYGVRDYKLKFGADIYDYGRYVRIHKTLMYWIGSVGIKILKLLK